MRVSLWLILLPCLALAGCATSPAPAPDQAAFTGADSPANALIIQRALLTAHGREFPLTGYLAVNDQHDLRLVVTQVFGQGLADVLVLHDGTVRVLQSSPMLRPAWIERYVAADLNCIFGKPAPGSCPARRVSATHFRIERRPYTLDVRILETKPGPQPAELFEAAPAGHL
jgi:hypothetical protein